MFNLLPALFLLLLQGAPAQGEASLQARWILWELRYVQGIQLNEAEEDALVRALEPATAADPAVAPRLRPSATPTHWPEVVRHEPFGWGRSICTRAGP